MLLAVHRQPALGVERLPVQVEPLANDDAEFKISAAAQAGCKIVLRDPLSSCQTR
jgi:hypothetical protein